MRRRLLLPALVAAPAVLVGLLGLAHPVLLTPATAERWRLLHLLLLPAFPLLAVPVWVLLRGERGVVAWSARLLAAAYAVLYGALDAIAGIGAGHQVVLAARRGGARPPVEDLYAIGDPLGQFGVGALALVGVAVQFRRAGGALGAAGAALGLASCAVLWRHHVFPPSAGSVRPSGWKQLRRRYLTGVGLWPEQDGTTLFNPAAVTITRYRYRRDRISSPWAQATAVIA